MFRVGNHSTKKLVASPRPLTLDTAPLSDPAPATPHMTLTPVSADPDQRSSYNSSNTLSSDDNTAASTRTPHRTPSTPATPVYLSSQDSAPAQPPPSPRTAEPPRARKEKPRMLGRARAPPPSPGSASQMSFAAPPMSPSTSRGPLSPRSIGANATRFIRRVASAPNAKGLFSLKPAGSTTRNGLLSPGDHLPPVPHHGHGEQGAASLETLSSSSSRGHPASRKEGQLAVEGPGKMAFRRTYSSHSIKVRSVRRCASFVCVLGAD